mgnify:CR=1 FL=1
MVEQNKNTIEKPLDPMQPGLEAFANHPRTTRFLGKIASVLVAIRRKPLEVADRLHANVGKFTQGQDAKMRERSVEADNRWAKVKVRYAAQNIVDHESVAVGQEQQAVVDEAEKIVGDEANRMQAKQPPQPEA